MVGETVGKRPRLHVPIGRTGKQGPSSHAAATFAAIGLVAALVLFHGEGSVNGEGFVSMPPVRFLRRADMNHRLPAPLRADPNAHLLRPLDQGISEKNRVRPPWIHPSLLNRITRMNKEGIKTTFMVWHRDSTIIPSMIGHTIAVHNGRDHIPITISEGMVGYRLKDFVPTHTFKGHPKRAKATRYRG